MSLITVHRAARTFQPCVSAHWDAESSTVSCDIEYAAAPEENRTTLRDEIDRQFNITAPTYFITGGMFSMALDSQKRIKDWDIYTNPARWTEYTLPFADATPATPIIDTVFDRNGRAEDMGEPDTYYEPLRGTLYLSWSEATAWYAVAPSLALGVMSDDTLAQIRLDGLFVQRAAHGPTGRWTRLLRCLRAGN
ncbi:conserved hypothetical protein [Paraburkholderia piptadeniae]|uniref:Uncharacterized protein n=1 Tax=Paraburkholderia piptadeniae TaxID=1701573 RepID=A0A1N7SJ59_9BURK|nr:hypothetical protein [Paraburkholderia piptadeniae]SIT47442.1 conserved hypothetical protein [Paraburkholderia piptadeniae]